jgi:hypothetical protein
MKGFGRWLAHEVREMIPTFLFFLVVFGLSRITMVIVLEEHHLTVTGAAVAVIGALVVAKAILIADALPFTRRYAGRPLVYVVAWKTIIYGLITLAFRYVEELIPLWRKYHGFAEANRRMVEDVSWPHFWAVQLWVTFSLLAFCIAIELIDAIGRERARELFFGGPARPGAHQSLDERHAGATRRH